MLCDHAPSGTVCHPWAWTCCDNLRTNYENMKGNAKYKNWCGWRVRGHPRSPAMSPFDRAHETSYKLPHLHLAIPFEFRPDLWYQKIKVPGFSTELFA